MTDPSSRAGATAALVVAAGSGSRFGGDVPKQYRMLGDKSVLGHACAHLASHRAVTTLIVVVAPGQEDEARAHVDAAAVIVPGGATRRASVRAGLEALAQIGGVARVLIHDAARPFVPHAVIDRLCDALDRHDAAIPVLDVVDTVARRAGDVVGEAVDRTGLCRVQTPQAFALAPILDAHRNWDGRAEPTDDASMMRTFGHDVATVAGDDMLDKITHADDLARAHQRLGALMTPRVGTGYDVHRFDPACELWLGGVKIPHAIGLAGHSDADVAIHALVDALLGALADGDIGAHFPPSDPQWWGAPSSQFLCFAGERVRARGGRIVHVDLTIICEAPKIGPHRDAMRAALAAILAIDMARVSVKATTTERLGFTGRREGIAAQAVATILLPEV